MIERMSGHVVVCGYGRMGRAVVAELLHGHRDVVALDGQARLAGLVHKLAGKGDTVICVASGGNVDADLYRRALETCGG